MRSTPLPDQLSVVAVPIGNPKDITPRAIEALVAAQVIFCEDTRKTADLFKRCGIELTGKLIAVPGDSEHDMEWLRFCTTEYRRWAVVSDAGTPIVNDPGVSLLSFCQRHQVRVEALPGASAPILAWQWSGGFGLPFIFAGFAPKVSSTATTKWDRFLPQQRNGTLCFFDTRHQVIETLLFLENAYPESRLYLAREMTKSHEDLLAGSPATLLLALQKLIDGDRVGELCLLLDLASLKSTTDNGNAHVAEVGLPLEDLIKFRSASTKEASKLLAKWCQINPRDAYKRLCDDER